MKKIIAMMVALLMTMTYVPVYAADGDIVDIAVKNGSFTTLVAALTQADLVGALQGEGPFTVFAPTDAAFAKLLADLGITAEDLLAHPDLSKVLLYHVVSGSVLSTDLTDQMKATTLNGASLTVDLSDGVKINTSNVVTADIIATNGVIHVIDEVLVPDDFKLVPEETMTTTEVTTSDVDIVDIALSDDNFSMLVMLLQKADLVGALQGEGPFTVFAPTNAAFESLLSALNITAEELMAQPDLSKVLLYHVVSGKVLSTDLTDGLMAPTLNGESLTFDLSSGVKVNKSNVTLADLMASNGVVHVIDSVLVPSDFTLMDVAGSEEDIPKTGDVSVLPLTIAGFISLGALGFIGKKKINK